MQLEASSIVCNLSINHCKNQLNYHSLNCKPPLAGWNICWQCQRHYPIRVVFLRGLYGSYMSIKPENSPYPFQTNSEFKFQINFECKFWRLWWRRKNLAFSSNRRCFFVKMLSHVLVYWYFTLLLSSSFVLVALNSPKQLQQNIKAKYLPRSFKLYVCFT